VNKSSGLRRSPEGRKLRKWKKSSRKKRKNNKNVISQGSWSKLAIMTYPHPKIVMNDSIILT
jgi:hypothetical protein